MLWWQLVDLDVVLTECPLRALHEALVSGLIFHASKERHVTVDGLRSHLALLRPSREVFALLMNNAIQGVSSRRDQIPYTLA